MLPLAMRGPHQRASWRDGTDHRGSPWPALHQTSAAGLPPWPSGYRVKAHSRKRQRRLHMKNRLIRFLVLALIGAVGKAVRNKIQGRNQAAEDDRRMAREVPRAPAT